MKLLRIDLLFLNFFLIIISLLIVFFIGINLSINDYSQWNNLLLALIFFAIPQFGFGDGYYIKFIGYSLNEISFSYVNKKFFILLSHSTITSVIFSFGYFYFFNNFNLFIPLIYIVLNLIGFLFHFFNSLNLISITIQSQIIQKLIFIIFLFLFSSYISFNLLINLYFFSLFLSLLFLYIFFYLKRSQMKGEYIAASYFSLIISGFPILINGLSALLLFYYPKVILANSPFTNEFNVISLLNSLLSFLTIFFSTYGILFHFKLTQKKFEFFKIEYLILFYLVFLFFFLYIASDFLILLLEAIFSNYTFNFLILYYSFISVSFNALNHIFLIPYSKFYNKIKLINYISIISIFIYSVFLFSQIGGFEVNLLIKLITLISMLTNGFLYLFVLNYRKLFLIILFLSLILFL